MSPSPSHCILSWKLPLELNMVPALEGLRCVISSVGNAQSRKPVGPAWEAVCSERAEVEVPDFIQEGPGDLHGVGMEGGVREWKEWVGGWESCVCCFVLTDEWGRGTRASWRGQGP